MEDLLKSIMNALNMMPNQKNVGLNGESSYQLASALDNELKKMTLKKTVKAALSFSSNVKAEQVVLTPEDQKHQKELRMAAMILYDQMGEDIDQKDRIIERAENDKDCRTDAWIVKSWILERNFLVRMREQLHKDIISGNYDY